MKEALRSIQPAVKLNVADDGDLALRILHRKGEQAGAARPSLILLDFNLPRSDSRDLLRHIKEDPDLRSIPVAVFTTSNADKDIRDAYDLYANCYLQKPPDLDSFLAAIRSAADFWLNIARLPLD